MTTPATNAVDPVRLYVEGKGALTAAAAHARVALAEEATTRDEVYALRRVLDFATEIKHPQALRRRRVSALLFALLPLRPCASSADVAALGTLFAQLIELLDDWHLQAAKLVPVILMLARSMLAFDETIRVPGPAWLRRPPAQGTFALRSVAAPAQLFDDEVPADLPPTVALICGLFTHVDTPVYEDALRLELLSCLRACLSESIEQCVKLLRHDSLILEVVHQGKCESKPECLAQIYGCLLELANAGVKCPAEKRGLVRNPKTYRGPDDQDLAEVWPAPGPQPDVDTAPLTTADSGPTEEPSEDPSANQELTVLEQVKELFYESFPQTTVEYMAASSRCWQPQLTELLWDFWLDQIVLLADEPDEEQLVALERHILLSVLELHNPLHIAGLFSPLVELLKICLWSSHPPPVMSRVASELLFGVSVKYSRAGSDFDVFRDLWTSVAAMTALLKRTTPVKSGPAFDSPEFRCFRTLCEALALAGVKCSLVVALNAVPLLLQFCHFDILDSLHLYKSVGYIGPSVLSQLDWLNCVLLRLRKHILRWTAAGKPLLVDSYGGVEFWDGIRQLWQRKIEPVIIETEPLFVRTLSSLAKDSPGYITWLASMKLLRWLEEQLLGPFSGVFRNAFAEEATPAVPDEAAASPPPTETAAPVWETIQNLKREDLYTLSCPELLAQLVHEARQPAPRGAKIAEDAVALWKKTNDPGLLEAIAKHHSPLLESVCRTLDPAAPLSLIESLVLRAPEQFLGEAFRAPFVHLALWARMLEKVSLKPVPELCAQTDLERLKLLVLLLRADAAEVATASVNANEDMNSVAYAWKFAHGLLEGVVPVLGCPVDVKLCDAQWLWRESARAECLGPLRECGAHWRAYAQRRAVADCQSHSEGEGGAVEDECWALLTDCVRDDRTRPAPTSRLGRALKFFQTRN